MSKTNPLFYEITNKSTANKTVDILMYGAIPSWDQDTWKIKNTADKFVRDFKALEKEYDRINIRINSPGGSLYHGFPIFNAVINSKKEIHTYNDGLAASMGGLLLLAGKTVHSAQNGMLMIHNAMSWGGGNADQLREMAKVLDKYDELIANKLAKKTGMTKEEVMDSYLNYKDHYLTPEEALEEKFIDEIDDYEAEEAPPANIANMNHEEVMAFYRPKDEDKSFFNRVTEHVRKTLNLSSSHGAPKHPNPPAPPAKNQSPNSNQDHMDFKDSLELLNKGELTAEDIAAVKAEIQQFTGANERFTSDEVQAKVDDAVKPVQAQVDTLTNEKGTLETEVSNLKTEKDNLAKTVNDLKGEKTTLETENNGLKLDIEAYRKSGVKPTNTKGKDPEKIEGEESPENYFSETDKEVRNLRKQMGYPDKSEKAD
ncbi:hypothetical protein DN752_17885 [Echinicola strongylocentroti]|uniref:ATP-dependent Clp protease proteolytic subunit n=1 Tax=Echinicola strongylocentroti TaxID=1795355 RepID=A0A2Z4IL66_9BACT|nr:head maturation protease, ClpP-related [Echinicola strongylocentroti]AWW31851.1 hypothetical protein DN752_17885 [Echinicola strongylocentroti]